jgi:hypothetical protein
MNHPNTDIYGRIRCGLVHEYIIRANAKIVIEGGDCGIVYDDKSKTYIFCIRRYLEDLKFAVDKYIAELRSDLASFNATKKALENKPQLI